MSQTNVITIEPNIPLPAVIGRGDGTKYNFIDTMQINDSFVINGNTPDFSAISVRAHVYKLNSKTERNYTIRTLSGQSTNPIAIRVWRTL